MRSWEDIPLTCDQFAHRAKLMLIYEEEELYWYPIQPAYTICRGPIDEGQKHLGRGGKTG